MEKIKAQHPLIKDGWHPVDYKKTATMTMLLALKATELKQLPNEGRDLMKRIQNC